MSAAVRLLALDLRRIADLARDATRLDGTPVADGALPPFPSLR